MRFCPPMFCCCTLLHIDGMAICLLHLCRPCPPPASRRLCAAAAGSWKLEAPPALRAWEIRYRDLRIIKEIGRGSYGKVYPSAREIWGGLKLVRRRMQDTAERVAARTLCLHTCEHLSSVRSALPQVYLAEWRGTSVAVKELLGAGLEAVTLRSPLLADLHKASSAHLTCTMCKGQPRHQALHAALLSSAWVARCAMTFPCRLWPLQEATLMLRLHHSNIVTFMGVTSSPAALVTGGWLGAKVGRRSPAAAASSARQRRHTHVPQLTAHCHAMLIPPQSTAAEARCTLCCRQPAQSQRLLCSSPGRGGCRWCGWLASPLRNLWFAELMHYGAALSRRHLALRRA